MKSLETRAQCGQQIGHYFGLSDAPWLATAPVKRAVLTVTRLVRQAPDDVPVAVRMAPENAYFLMLYLGDARHCDIREDGSVGQVRLYTRGSLCLVDLKQGVSIMLHSALNSLAFIVPYELFAEMGEIMPHFGNCELRCRRGEPDAVVDYIGQALLPLFQQPGPLSPPGLRHMAIALCTHLLDDPGSALPATDASVQTAGNLTVLQQKAAKDFALRHLQENISVSRIAAAAGVSTRRLSLGFRELDGCTPYQWLMRARIDRAKDLLTQPALSLQKIAHRCGFTDHSHFSRVFSKQTGMTPGVWRNYSLQ